MVDQRAIERIILQPIGLCDAILPELPLELICRGIDKPVGRFLQQGNLPGFYHGKIDEIGSPGGVFEHIPDIEKLRPQLVKADQQCCPRRPSGPHRGNPDPTGPREGFATNRRRPGEQVDKTECLFKVPITWFPGGRWDATDSGKAYLCSCENNSVKGQLGILSDLFLEYIQILCSSQKPMECSRWETMWSIPPRCRSQ